MSETRTANETIVTKVRERYGRIAVTGGGCGCGSAATSPGDMTRAIGYDGPQLAEIPAEADLGLGCGAPIDALNLEAGETVLDLGSGGGLDAFLAARRVGPTGRVVRNTAFPLCRSVRGSSNPRSSSMPRRSAIDTRLRPARLIPRSRATQVLGALGALGAIGAMGAPRATVGSWSAVCRS